LILGDSVSAGFGMNIRDGWVTLLQQKLDAEGYGYKVINASISGETTSGGLKRLPRALKVHQPEIVIIELGGNDGLRALPIPVFKQNLTDLMTLSLDSGATVVLAGMQMPPNYGDDYTQQFAAVYFDLAEELDVALIPFFLKNIALNPSLMQADQIHPTAEAQPLLLENSWDTLEPLLTPVASTPAVATN